MKNIQHANVVVLVFLSLNLLGCATITRGTKDVLVINSDPVGAGVKLSNGLSGMTPCSFKVSKKGTYTVTISKEGYETLFVVVNSKISGGGSLGMAGNVLFGGLIGAGVDAASGAMNELVPNPIFVQLEPVKEEQTPDVLSSESEN